MKCDQPDFQHNRLLQGLFAALLLLWVIMAIAPFNRRDWLLENLLVFFFGTLLVLTYRRFTFSNISYVLFSIFMSLHLIGAHYTYSEVPLGLWLQDTLNLPRNHYDRIVHFSFGLLIAYPFRELLMRAAGVVRSWSYIMTLTVVLAFSAFYEVMESIIAILVDPELGMAYLGAQGDEWDAQKDTFLAFSGALVAMVVIWLAAKVL